MAQFITTCPQCGAKGEVILRGLPVMSYCAFISDKNLPTYLAGFRGLDVQFAHPHSKWCHLTDDQWNEVHPRIRRTA